MLLAKTLGVEIKGSRGQGVKWSRDQVVKGSRGQGVKWSRGPKANLVVKNLGPGCRSKYGAYWNDHPLFSSSYIVGRAG